MFCEQCGTRLNDNAKFCSNCGTKVTWAVPMPAAKPEPEPVVIPEPAAEPEPEPVVIPEPAAEPEPEPVVIPEPVAEPVIVAEPVVIPEPVFEPAPVVQPEVKAAPAEAPKKKGFMNILMKLLCPAVTVVLIVFGFQLALFCGDDFFHAGLLGNLCRDILMVGAFAACVAMTAKEGGADLSVIGMIGFYSVVYARIGGFGGVLLVLTLAVLFGGGTGALIKFTKIPGVAATASTGLFGFLLVILLAQNGAVPMYYGGGVALVLLSILCAGGVIAASLFLGAKGTPDWNGIRPRKITTIIIYAISAVTVAIISMCWTKMIGVGLPRLGIGMSSAVIIAASLMIGTKGFTDRWYAVPAAAGLTALVDAIYNTLFTMFGLSSALQSVLMLFFVVGPIAAAAVFIMIVGKKKTA